MDQSSKKLLNRILFELAEQELSAVPSDEEIRETHIFSERFLRNMQPVLVLGAQEAGSESFSGLLGNAERNEAEKMETNEMTGKKISVFAGKVRSRQRRIRILAACIACALVFGVVLTAWNGTFSLRMGSSADSGGSADMVGITEESADDYAADDSETAEVTEESAANSADSGTMDSQTLTDADAAGTTDDTETGESSGNESSSYEQKLIRTVNLTAETTDFDKTVASVKAKTEELGGYVESSEMDTSADSVSRWAYLTLRIPADELDVFLEQVEGETNVTYSSESTEDVTLTYSDLESHVAALRTEQETLLSMLEQATTMEDILAIQSQLTEVRYEIESYESQLKVYDNKVNYSTVYLDLSEVTHETSGMGSTFGEQVGNRFRDSLYKIANGFRSFAIGFLGAIPYLVMVAVIAVACVFVYRKVRKLQKKIHDRKTGKEEHTEE